MTATQWYLKLEGSDRDLERLSQLNVEGWTITASEGTYAVTSPDFDGLADLYSVEDKAEHVVFMLNAAARLHFVGFNGVKAGDPYGIRPDGTRTQFVYSDYSNIVSATTFGIGDVEPIAPGDPPAGIFGVTIALRGNPDVQRVLRHLQNDDLWTARYRLVYEAIKIDVDPIKSHDGKVLSKIGWVPQSQHDRFWNAIHDDSAVETGDDALHIQWGNRRGASAMTRDEAKDFIFSLVRTWLRWKHANQVPVS
jgi:hypothetical protein